MPSIDDVAQVFKSPRDSGFGLDTFPYSVYSPCRRVSVACVMCFINLLLQSACDLNISTVLAFIVFLPKKPLC